MLRRWAVASGLLLLHLLQLRAALAETAANFEVASHDAMGSGGEVGAPSPDRLQQLRQLEAHDRLALVTPLRLLFQSRRMAMSRDDGERVHDAHAWEGDVGAAEEQQPTAVFIVLTHTWDGRERLTEDIRTAQSSTSSSSASPSSSLPLPPLSGVTVLHALESSLPGLVVRCGLDAVAALCEHADVALVEEDRPVFSSDMTGSAALTALLQRMHDAWGGTVPPARRLHSAARWGSLTERATQPRGSAAAQTTQATPQRGADTAGRRRRADEATVHGAAVRTQTTAPWALDRLDQKTRPVDGSFSYDFDGTGMDGTLMALLPS
jgi:hypothetical protein